MSRRWLGLVLVVVLGAPVTACSDDGPGEGEARLEVEGEATVERADGDRETVDGGTDLSSGDRVSVTEGSAVMRLRGGTTYELRQGFGSAAPTTVLMAARPVLEAGDLLVATPESTHLEADGTKVEVTEGAARVTRAFGMSVSSYDADVSLDSAGVPAEVPALRRMVVPDLGRPARAPRPVDYDEENPDPWDLRYLGAAMALDENLSRLARQLTGQLPEGEGRTVGFLRLVLPGLEGEDELDQDDIDGEREAGEILIGAAITDLGERGSFSERWDDVFGFRDEGAAWGVVALDQAVRSEPLVGSVEEAFNTSVEDLAASAPDTGPSDDLPTPTTPDSGDTTDGGTDDGTRGGTDDGGGGTDGGSPPTTEPPPVTPPIVPPIIPPATPETPPALAPVVDPVVDLIEDLVGGLLG